MWLRLGDYAIAGLLGERTGSARAGCGKQGAAQEIAPSGDHSPDLRVIEKVLGCPQQTTGGGR